ncbi:MAG TPA: hypothetical protein VF530_11880 [Planctomycetota bacterium]
MPNPIENQIKERISAFVHELDLLVRKSTLEALQEMLSGGGTSAPRRGRPAGSGRKPGRPRGRGRAPADLGGASEAILTHVRANDGQGISAIADATGIDLKVAKKAAGQLLAAGQLAKSGAKRGTVYHIGSGRPARATKGKRGKRGKRGGRRAKAA